MGMYRVIQGYIRIMIVGFWVWCRPKPYVYNIIFIFPQHPDIADIFLTSIYIYMYR